MLTPYSKVYDAIWALLESSEEFKEHCSAANRIKFSGEGDRQPQKGNQQSADTPEIMLVANGGPLNLNNTSSTTRVNQAFDLVVNTGDYRLNEFVFPISWIVTCKAKEWCNTISALKWNGESFVKVVRITNNTIGESLERRQTGIKGWSTLIRFDVEMHFGTATQLTISEL